MHRIVLAWCLLAGPLWGQSVKLPEEVKVAPGRLAAVTIEWEGADLKWDVPPALDAFREYDPDPRKVRLRLIGYASGRHRLIAVAASKEGRLSEFAACIIVVGEPVPPVPPIPPVPPVPPEDPFVRALREAFTQETDPQRTATLSTLPRIPPGAD